LSQLYGFIQQSGGVVRLESAPGQGTTVRLYLPRHEPAPTEVSRFAITGRHALAVSATVLVVDDEVQVRTVVREVLREMQYHVLEVSDGLKALQMFHDEVRRVDLLVTEVDLPGDLDGWALVDAARRAKPDLPVLLMTADIEAISRSKLASGMEMIGKPFALNAFSRKVRSMIEAAS
jgi:CheY-like chemotaxis protein